jgi:hypothetical protein
VLEQAQSLERGESPAGGVTGERVRCTPEHRQPGVQRGPDDRTTSAVLSGRRRVRRPDRVGSGRVGEDQRHVDVADQRAEAAVGETAQGVGREQPSIEGLPTGADRVGENIVTGGAPRAGLGRRRPVRAVVVAQAAEISVHRRSDVRHQEINHLGWTVQRSVPFAGRVEVGREPFLIAVLQYRLQQRGPDAGALRPGSVAR